MDRSVELEKLRLVLVDRLEGADGSAAASLSRELRLVLAELSALGAGAVSEIDELAGRRKRKA